MGVSNKIINMISNKILQAGYSKLGCIFQKLEVQNCTTAGYKHTKFSVTATIR